MDVVVVEMKEWEIETEIAVDAIEVNEAEIKVIVDAAVAETKE